MKAYSIGSSKGIVEDCEAGMTTRQVATKYRVERVVGAAFGAVKA